VPLHGVPELVEPLAAYYREQLGLQVEILRALQPPTDTFDEQRGQMVSRNVGIMLFALPLNANRDGLMYQDVMGVDELDRVDEDLAAAGFPVPAR
jgi:hypothetical protein